MRGGILIKHENFIDLKFPRKIFLKKISLPKKFLIFFNSFYVFSTSSFIKNPNPKKFSKPDTKLKILVKNFKLCKKYK